MRWSHKNLLIPRSRRHGLGKAGAAHGSNVVTVRRYERFKGQKDGDMIALATWKATSKNNIPKAKRKEELSR